jgi:hypothetical protein
MIGTLRAILFSPDRFTTTFTLGRGKDALDVTLWDRPGRFCSDDELASMVRDLREVAADGQRGKPVPEYGVLLGDRDDLKNRVITIVRVRATGEPVGFSALCWMDLTLGVRTMSVLHLGLVYVSPEHQHKHFSNVLYGAPTLLMLMKRGLEGFWISNVSQVPSAIGLTASHYDAVYPNVDDKAQQSFRHLVLARAIMKTHRHVFGVGEDATFDEARQVIQNAYTGGSDNLKKTFDDAPKHRDPRINELCRTRLDYQRGDDFLQLGRCNVRAILRFFQQKLPKNSAVQILSTATSLLIGGLLVPVVRWLMATEATPTSLPPRSTPEVLG